MFPNIRMQKPRCIQSIHILRLYELQHAVGNSAIRPPSFEVGLVQCLDRQLCLGLHQKVTNRSFKKPEAIQVSHSLVLRSARLLLFQTAPGRVLEKCKTVEEKLTAWQLFIAHCRSLPLDSPFMSVGISTRITLPCFLKRSWSGWHRRGDPISARVEQQIGEYRIVLIQLGGSCRRMRFSENQMCKL